MGKGHFVMASEGLKTIVSGIHMAYFKSHVKLDQLQTDDCVLLLRALLSGMLAFLHTWPLFFHTRFDTVASMNWSI